jgi:O-antigen ligase/tetratricopeptide (TPR) repeat protein
MWSCSPVTWQLSYDKIIDYYRLRFQLEFNFRDAKQYWGLEDWMNIKEVPLTNALNLSLFMVNVSQVLLTEFRKSNPQSSVLDLKAYCRAARYFEETLKMLPQKPEPILYQQVFGQSWSRWAVFMLLMYKFFRHNWRRYCQMLFMLALLAYTSLRTVSDRLPWENALITLGLIVSIWSCVEIIDWYLRYIPTQEALEFSSNFQRSYRLRGGLFDHPNPLAGFLNFLWPIVFIRIYHSKRIIDKFLYGVLILLFALTIFYTNSRGALMGTFGGVLVILFIYVLGKFARKKISFSFNNKKLITTIVGTIGLMLIIIVAILWRTQFTGQNINRSFSGRGTIWKYSWDAFVENPIFGQGIAAFPISYTKFAQLPPGDFAPSAHNLWLQVSVDYGIIGLFFICILMIVFIFFGGKKIWVESSEQPKFYVAYLVGGVAFLLQQTVDYLLMIPNFLISVIFILVLMSKYSLEISEWKLNRLNFLLLGAIFISFLVGYQVNVNSKIMSLEKRTSLEYSIMDEGTHPFYKDICPYTIKYPDNALYKFECSLAISHHIFYQVRNNNWDKDLLENAIEYQESGIDLNPFWSTQEGNLAALYWVYGDKKSALVHMENAANAAPMYDLFWLNLGWMAEQTDDRETALYAYERALRINPMINKSAFVQHSAYISEISEISENLEAWMEQEELWDEWYGKNRHDRTKYDKPFWRGVIALSTDQTELAIDFFENSSGGRNGNDLFAHSAYAYDKNGQVDLALSTARDYALLVNNRIRNETNITHLSMVASLFRKNGEVELAYDLLLFAFQNEKERTPHTHKRYYRQLYNQQILIPEFSPWLIRNYLIPADSLDDWYWVLEETLQRGDVQLSEEIHIWLEQLPGIAILQK